MIISTAGRTHFISIYIFECKVGFVPKNRMKCSAEFVFFFFLQFFHLFKVSYVSFDIGVLFIMCVCVYSKQFYPLIVTANLCVCMCHYDNLSGRGVSCVRNKLIIWRLIKKSTEKNMSPVYIWNFVRIFFERLYNTVANNIVHVDDFFPTLP